MMLIDNLHRDGTVTTPEWRRLTQRLPGLVASIDPANFKNREGAVHVQTSHVDAALRKLMRRYEIVGILPSKFVLDPNGYTYRKLERTRLDKTGRPIVVCIQVRTRTKDT